MRPTRAPQGVSLSHAREREMHPERKESKQRSNPPIRCAAHAGSQPTTAAEPPQNLDPVLIPDRHVGGRRSPVCKCSHLQAPTVHTALTIPATACDARRQRHGMAWRGMPIPLTRRFGLSRDLHRGMAFTQATITTTTSPPPPPPVTEPVIHPPSGNVPPFNRTNANLRPEQEQNKEKNHG